MKVLSDALVSSSWYTKQKSTLPHNFFCYKYLNLPRNQLFCTKEPNFWQASDCVITLDASFFKSSRSQMFYKIDVLKNPARHRKNTSARVFLLIKLLTSRKRLRHSCFPVNFVKHNIIYIYIYLYTYIYIFKSLYIV